MSDLVFVYGTLKKGYGNHHLLKNAEFVGDATVKGTLYVEGLPMYRSEGDGVVHGELYQVDNVTLGALDMLEGYRKSTPQYSLYNRVSVDSCVISPEHPDSDIGHIPLDTVYIYEINRDCSAYQPIASGVFQYG